MLFPASPKRFIPRSQEASAAVRRQAALQALVSDLVERVDGLQKEQNLTLRRIGQLQQDIDELKKLLKKVSRP